jgi:hypothetical protein
VRKKSNSHIPVKISLASKAARNGFFLPSAGVANVGLHTNLYAFQLIAERYGVAARVATLAIGSEGERRIS